MISPLISITYSIDKMGDGKAQALGNWLREFIFTILIQPFHCLMYIAFVRTAFTLITSNGNILSIQSFADGIDLLTSPDYNQLVNGVLAILCLKFINDGEKIVRKIFGFQDDNSLTSMAAGMAVGMMAVKNAKKMGATARKGINMAKGGASRIGQAIKSDAAKNIPGISKIANKLDGINDKITNLSDKINDKKTAWKKGFDQSGFGRVYNKATSLPGKFKATKIGGRLASANSLSSTLAVMGAAMAYSTGTTSAGEALGVGSAIGQGTQELFASSTKNISNQNGMSHTSEEQKAYDDLEKSMDTVEDIMNDPDKMSETEAAFSDFEEADKQSAIAKECDAQISKLQADKRDGNADQDVDQQIESLKAKSDAAKLAAEAALLSGRSKDKFGDLEDLYKKLELGPEKDKDGNDMSFAKRLEHAKGDLFDKMKNFNDVGERYSRFSKRATKPKTEEMDAIKNEIIRKLTLLKLNQKSTNDSNVSRELSVDEEDSIERTADRLMQNITGGVLAGRKYSTKDQIGLVKSGLGLDSRADDSSFSALINATSEFETLKQRESISGLHKYHSDYGGDDTALLERELRATPHATGRHTKEIVRQEKDERKNKKSQESGH